MGIIMALVSGILMSIQGVFNTGVTKQSSIWVACGLVHITAFAVCVLAWFTTGLFAFNQGKGASAFASWKVLGSVEPKYMLTGGLIGAFITLTVIKGMNSLGAAKAALLIVIAQIAAAYLIELFGLFGVEKADFVWRKLIGFVIAVGGIILFEW